MKIPCIVVFVFVFLNNDRVQGRCLYSGWIGIGFLMFGDDSHKTVLLSAGERSCILGLKH